MLCSQILLPLYHDRAIYDLSRCILHVKQYIRVASGSLFFCRFYSKQPRDLKHLERVKGPEDVNYYGNKFKEVRLLLISSLLIITSKKLIILSIGTAVKYCSVRGPLISIPAK